jgi:hypothetical protein
MINFSSFIHSIVFKQIKARIRISRYIYVVLLAVNVQIIVAANIPESHILSFGQSSDYERLKWSEINSDTILHHYFLPTYILPGHNSELRSLKAWHDISNLSISYRTEIDSKYTLGLPGLRGIVSGTALIKLGRSINFQYDFEIDSDGLKDPEFRGYQPEAFGGWSGYLRQELVHWKFNSGHFIGGKGNISTSIFNNSILKNSNNPPEEFLWWHIAQNMLTVDWSLIFFDPVNGFQRFFSLHRYGLQSQSLSIGFSEAVVAMYQDFGAMELRYLSPSSFFYETEVNGGKNSNILWNFDLTYKWRKYSLVGEFLVDDYAIDGKTPPKLAFKIGLGRNGQAVDWYSEYVRVNKWTGNHFDEQLRLTDHGVLLGHPIGPDSHSLRSELFCSPYDWLELTYTLIWIESGDGNIDEWPAGIGASENFGFSTEPFPSKPLVSEYQSELSISVFRFEKCNAELIWSTYSSAAPVYAVLMRLAL